jgi:Flp pilus assembly protein CpaB
MVTYRLRNIVLAVVLAVMAAVLVFFYVSNYKRSVQQGEDSVRVFVATRDISAGTSGAAVTPSLKPVDVAKRNVVPGALASPEQVKDLVSTDSIYAGEQVSVRRFRPVKEGGVRAELKGNVRAIEVHGSPHQLLAGTLRRGDHVDVIANFKFKIKGDERDRSATRVILRDVPVLRAPGNPSAGSKLTSLDTVSAQLAVTDGQAQKLFFAFKNGDWHLDLRPPVKATDSPESLETLDTMLCDGMRKDRPGTICFGRGVR